MTDLLKFSNTSPADPFYQLDQQTKDADSMLSYPGFFATTNEAHRMSKQSPISGSTPAYGDKIIFEIDKSQFQTGQVWLQWTRSALTQGAGSTQTAFVDCEAYATIDRIDVTQGSNDLEKKDGRYYFIERSRFREKETDRIAEAPLILGDLTFAERQINSLGNPQGTAAFEQTLWLRLDLWWAWWTKMYPMTSILGSKLQITIYFKQLADITTWNVGGSAPTCTIKSCNLVYMSYYLPRAQEAFNSQKVMTTTGLQYRVLQWTRQEAMGSAGQTSIAIQLQNFRLPCVCFFFHIRKVSQINAQGTASFATKSLNDYLSWNSFKLDAGDIEVVRSQDSKFNICALQRQYLKEPTFEKIGGWFFSWDPASVVSANGHKSWSEMTNPTLTIELPDPGEAFVVDVYSKENNTIIHKGGTFKKLLT